MSKSVIFDSRQSVGISTAVWQLTQTLWVGGLWLLQLVILPAIGQTGLAPLLVADISAQLVAVLVGLAVVGAGLQMLALLRHAGPGSLWRDVRGQLLVAVVLLALSRWLVGVVWPDVDYWLRFSYLLMAACGALLVLQPAPGAAARR